MGRFVLITGSDEFAIKNRARELADRWAGGDAERNPDWEFLAGDAGDADPVELLGAAANSLCTPPFFGDGKTLWLRNFLFFDRLDSTDAALKAAWERLAKLLKEGLPEGVDFLWSGPGLDQRKSAAKGLKACPGAEIEVYNSVNSRSKDFAQAMQQRLSELCSSWGKTLEPRAAELLIAAVGADTARLQTELEKLFTFLGPERNRATLADVRQVVSATPEALGWEFAQALQARDAKAALAVVNDLIRQMKGTRSSGFELSMLYTAAGAFSDILNTRQAMAELEVPRRIGPNYFSALDPALKERHPDNMLLSLHPFRAYKLCETALGFGDADLKRIFSALLDTNVALVTGGGEARLVLERMILSICRGGAG